MSASDSILRALQVPDELIAMRRSVSEPRRSYRLWSRALDGEPIDEAFAEESSALLAKIAELVPQEEVDSWTRRIEESASEHEVIAEQIVERSEALSRGYREARREAALDGFASLAWWSRAYGAVASAHARRAGRREVRARELAALVGAGHAAFLQDSTGLCVDFRDPQNPANSELAYAFASVHEAWELLAPHVALSLPPS